MDYDRVEELEKIIKQQNRAIDSLFFITKVQTEGFMSMFNEVLEHVDNDDLTTALTEIADRMGDALDEYSASLMKGNEKQ